MKKLTLIIGGAAALVLLGVSIWTQQSQKSGSLELAVIPKDATVTLDGRKADPGTIKLSPGNHQVVVSRDGFKSKTVNITIVAKQRSAKTIALEAANQTGVDYLKNNPEQIAEAEGADGKETEERGVKITQNNPLIKLLPYRGNGFAIDLGLSEKHPNDPEAVGIYIHANDEATKTKALNWIKAQGYNPAAYEIIYSLEESGS